MSYIVYYEDGSMENVEPKTHHVIGQLSISEALFELYCKMYVQDFRLEEFKKWWSANALNTYTHALYRKDGTRINELVHYSVAMDRTKTVELYLAIDNGQVFFIHPTGQLRANKMAATSKWIPRTEVSA